MSTGKTFADILEKRISRRALLLGAGTMGAVSLLPSLLKAELLSESPSTLKFEEISKGISKTHRLAKGYEAQMVIGWGDKLFPDSPKFEPEKQSPEAQKKQFGYNNDFTAFMPLPYGSKSSTHGLLCVNHEYSIRQLMFREQDRKSKDKKILEEIAKTELAAHGHSVVEIKYEKGEWRTVIGGGYNRRFNGLDTKFSFSGAAADAKELQGGVIGTIGNCAGGVTPWGTVLFAEENFDGYFTGKADKLKNPERYKRYGIGEKSWYEFGQYIERFNIEKQPDEPLKFGWVVEYDPYNPESKPVKRTSLGRFKHEAATCTLAADGRVVVYSGDDDYFEYIYKFVSRDKFDANNREANLNLLDNGTLYVAKFGENGYVEWIALEHGKNGLDEAAGFKSQADVLIYARMAADKVGATKMDRPEDIETNPVTGKVYVALTKNKKRDVANAANLRTKNIHGHIIEMIPMGVDGVPDHASEKFRWEVFLMGGSQDDELVRKTYHPKTSKDGYISCPDNFAFDGSGRIWITTDGQDSSIASNDMIYAVDTFGAGRGLSKAFFASPIGAECTGPSFTPDNRTLFVSIQHPAATDDATYEKPATRWPDFNSKIPPRPSVIAITKSGGGVIGS